jgi:hypothetical protein
VPNGIIDLKTESLAISFKLIFDKFATIRINLIT